jgi:hypothetical protein
LFTLGVSNLSPTYIDIERKNRLLKVCYVPATSATFLAFFVAVAINSTNEANKAGGVPLISLYYLDVYAYLPKNALVFRKSIFVVFI